MKFNKKFWRRISSMGLAAVLLFCLILPVSAESLYIDYYVSDVYTKNGTPYVTVDFPVDKTCWQSSLNSYLDQEILNSSSFIDSILLSDLSNYKINVYPLGYSGNFPDEDINKIDISEFPDAFSVETSCKLIVSFDSPLSDEITVNLKATYAQWNSSGKLISNTGVNESKTLTVGPSDGPTTQTVVFDLSKKNYVKNTAAVSMDFDYSINFTGVDGQDLTSSVSYAFVNERCAFNFSISEEFYEEMQKAQTNRLLGKIEGHLSEQNKTLDDILHGTPEQNQQAQDSLGGLKDSTDRLEDLGDVMASVDKPVIDSNQISAGNLVPQTSLTVLSSPFQALWENNQLLAMLTIVVTIVLVSWVFFGKKG